MRAALPVEVGQAEAPGRVYLIEDDAELRAGLVDVLADGGFEVFAYPSAEAFLSELSPLTPYTPAVIVSDMVLPGISGLELFKSVRALQLETPLIFISGYSEPHQIIDSMKLGAVDFLWKPFQAQALFDAVGKALESDASIQRQRHCNAEVRQKWQQLTDREKEVCTLMLDGYGNTEIARRLGIKPDTANKHRIKVLRKTGAASRPQLTALFRGIDMTTL